MQDHQQHIPKSKRPQIKIRTLMPAVISSSAFLVDRLADMNVEKARAKNLLVSMMSDIQHFEQSIPALKKEIGGLEERMKQQEEMGKKVERQMKRAEEGIQSIVQEEMSVERMERELTRILKEIDQCM